VRYGLPLDTWRNWSQLVTGTGLDKVGQAATALDPTRQIVVVVGPRKVAGESGEVDVVKELEALGYPVAVVP
jgi:hypothetical protein